jgi:KUP system potassium uptake protein
LAVPASLASTTLLAFGIMNRIWNQKLKLTALVLGTFLLIDLAFLTANTGKLPQGGWISLVIAGVVYTVLSTWKRGRELLMARINIKGIPLEELVSRLSHESLPRVPGSAVYLTASRFGAPKALLHNMNINKVLHEQVIILTVVTRDEPWVPLESRVKIRHFGGEIYRVRIYYGFNQEPNIPDTLAFCKTLGLSIDMTDTSFFLAREHMVCGAREGMALWRERLFIRMAMNAENAMVFWRVPPERVIELGLIVEL